MPGEGLSGFIGRPCGDDVDHEVVRFGLQRRRGLNRRGHAGAEHRVRILATAADHSP